MKNKRVTYTVAAIAVVFVVIFLGYKILQGEKPLEQGEKKIEKVSLRLKWVDQAQFAGYYLAKSQGLYEKRGLAVEINPGGPDISPVQMVTTGVNDFGITGADQIILAREKGVPLVALAVIYKESPVVIISLKEKNIEKPKDLEGKKVAVVYGRDEEVIYRALLAKEGVNSSKIKEVPSMASPTEIISQVDARVDYELNGGILMPLGGYAINMIKPRDYGLHFYADTIFTTEEMVKKNPELVRNFIQATIEGWKLAFSNKELAVEEVMRINKTLNREHQTRFLANSEPLIVGQDKIGQSSQKVWEAMQEMLLSQGALKKPIDLSQVYTSKFLD